jgi:hypothetical protein
MILRLPGHMVFGVMDINETENLEKIKLFLEHFNSLEQEDIIKIVESHISDDAIELFIEHIEEFYGIEDEDQLGMLAQLVVVGYLLGKDQYTAIMPDRDPSGGPKQVQ